MKNPQSLKKRAAALVLASGLAVGATVTGAGVAGAAEPSLPTGSTFSSGLNQGSLAISPFNDFIAQLIAQFSPGFHSPIPGPFVGSSGMGSSESILDFNLRR